MSFGAMESEMLWWESEVGVRELVLETANQRGRVPDQAGAVNCRQNNVDRAFSRTHSYQLLTTL
ncbi:hypothetical protein BKA81DRAFT_358219 [Phyllosticta paracitricarpa]